MTADLPLQYYDDGEALYHVLSLLAGRIPYLETWNHHFAGYVLPLALYAKVFGFSIELIRQYAFVNQLLTALGVFSCLRFFVAAPQATLGALLTILAREPYVLGFYKPYQLNLLMVWMWYACLCAAKYRSPRTLLTGFLLAGIAFTFDQRAGLFGIVPAVVAFTHRISFAGFVKAVSSGILAFLLPGSLLLGLLWSYGAIVPFYEQTIFFPQKYRSGSLSAIEMLLNGFWVQRFVVTMTPLLFFSAVAGFVAVMRSATFSRNDKFFLVACLVPIFLMPFVSGRDFIYYSIPALPWLAMCSVLTLSPALLLRPRHRRIVTGLLFVPLVISFMVTVQETRWEEKLRYRGDGIDEVTQFLGREMRAEESLFVYGYRLEIYSRLTKLSPYPFGSTIFFTPDLPFKSSELLSRHIYPAYEKQAFQLLEQKPATFLVIFTRDSEALPAHAAKIPADEFVSNLLQRKYDKVFESARKDFFHATSRFTIYRLQSNRI